MNKKIAKEICIYMFLYTIMHIINKKNKVEYRPVCIILLTTVFCIFFGLIFELALNQCADLEKRSKCPLPSVVIKIHRKYAL
eukprot:GAHX01004443.1.p1 GENE.GAHX01004443.1~~GAHX01004443.1.p1  ORF type:complete len:82 (-),score=4.29 GAHX01004443.1:54-299(-)